MTRKQLIFDLDTNVCKQIFGEKRYLQSYKDIEKFFKQEGWEHIERSAYMSVQKMDNLALSQILKDLIFQYPYLTKCIKNMHVANISDIHSLNATFDYDGTPGKFAQKEKGEQKQNKGKRQSVAKLLAEKKAIVEKQKKQISKNPKSKSHNQEL